ncbi:MAG TPA: glutamine-hydrolyzing GMP synthase, partial [Methanocorpusculum sp.]|nr:glutamine-hydrolyzing GMP synthase [Methanocorpusculum sp.]
MESVLVLDFGGQYNQLIARRVREANVFCEVKPCTVSLDEIKRGNYSGIIFTGGPASVYAEGAPRAAEGLFELGLPVLGICYGAQYTAYTLGGTVSPAAKREFGRTEISVKPSLLFEGVPKETLCWMSHGDQITKLPDGFTVSAESAVCPVAAMENPERKIYCVQFHPEVMHTPEGSKMIANFLTGVCGCKGEWKMSSFVEDTVVQLR